MSKHSAKGAAWEAQRQRVLQRDAWTCTYCNKHLEGKDAQVDHIHPISQTENTTYRDDELVAACATCNNKKGDRPLIRIPYFNNRWL